MSEVTPWRLALAQKIAPIYAAIPPIQAVILSGSLAHRTDDAFSDIDLACFWERPPSEDDRRAALNILSFLLPVPTHCDRWRAISILDDSASGRLWEEAVYIGEEAGRGLKIDISHRTLAGMERILDEVLIHHTTRRHHLVTLHAIQRGYILHGLKVVTGWQKRAAAYPRPLAHKIIRQKMPRLEGLHQAHIHLHRADWLPFYRAITDAQEGLLDMLLALNEIYRPMHKRIDRLCEPMDIRPPDLAPRLTGLFHQPPAEALAEIDTLTLDTLSLVDEHLPEIDTTPARDYLSTRRRPFDAPPFDMRDRGQ
jgi:hypothetical protein